MLGRTFISRCLFSLIAAKLDGSYRGQGHFGPLANMGLDTPLRAHDTNSALNIDSLKLMSLAMDVSTLFQIPDSGLEDYLLRGQTIGDWVDVVMESRNSGAQALAFTSSGSTGEPATYRHEWIDLLDEVRDLAPKFATHLGQPITRVVVCVPTHHIYGFLFGIVLPAVLDLPVLDRPQAMLTAHAGRFSDGDLIVGFPWFWRALAQAGTQFSESCIGLSSTGSLDADISPRLKARGLKAMIEIHGSSETAGIGYRSHGSDPYTLMNRWHVGPDKARLARNRDLSETVLLPDRVDWVDPRRYQLRGRLDQAIQVAGHNVYPDQIAMQIAQHPDIDQAYVRLMRPGEGDRLKAYVVPSDENFPPAQVKKRLVEWCRASLTTAQMPAVITVGSALPMNSLGKPADW